MCVVQVISQLREKRKPMIIDADGLYITTKDPGLLKGYDLAILTPNKYAALDLLMHFVCHVAQLLIGRDLAVFHIQKDLNVETSGATSQA